MVGPNYCPPTPVMPDYFCESSDGDHAPILNGVFFHWWCRFGDECLNELLNETARRNFDLKIAEEKICQARGQFLFATANLFPQFNFDGTAARLRSSKNVVGSLASLGFAFQNFFLTGFDAVWELDFFGRLRRARKAAFYDAEAAVELARDTQIRVLSEVAMQYALIRALQNKISITEELVQLDLDELGLVQDKMVSGLSSEPDLLSLREIYDQDVADLIAFKSLFLQGVYSLGILIGVQPETLGCRFDQIAPVPCACGLIPVGLPSQLLCRRPDIKAAERQLAEATENIGVNVANLFPVFSLTSANLFQSRATSSNFGFASDKWPTLFKSASQTWSVGLAAFLPLVDFGRNLANIRVAKSIQRQALLQYEKSVVGALTEVEKALAAYFKEEERLGALNDVVNTARRNFALAQDLFQAGLNSYYDALEKKRVLLLAEDDLVDSSQALATNLIAAYKALGGEWECFYMP